jgi:hypothetical protein
MKIGFYGDSFCCEESNPHSILKGYDTYIKQLRKHYDAEIVHLGHGGSSVWDVIINQFDPTMLPDVAIFCWTDYSRLYNKKVRNMTYGSITAKKFKDITISELFNRNVINAAKEYFAHLYDHEKALLENKAALRYFDQEVLSKIRKNTKIIHMWSTEKYYDWQNGIEIKTPLTTFVSSNDSNMSANHISGDNNKQVFNLLMTNISTS